MGDQTPIDVREPGDDWAVHFAGHQIHRLPIAARGDWETGFNDVDPGSASAFAIHSFSGGVMLQRRRLLAVAQRGIEDEKPVGVNHRYLDDGATQAKLAASFTSP